jgi:hypothetical protein
VLGGAAGIVWSLALTRRGFAIMIPMIAATVTATAVARYVDGHQMAAEDRGRAGALVP